MKYSVFRITSREVGAGYVAGENNARKIAGSGRRLLCGFDNYDLFESEHPRVDILSEDSTNFESGCAPSGRS